MSFFDHLVRLGYSSGMHQQLRGHGIDCNDSFGGDSVYQLTAIVLLAVSLVAALNYYYGLFNRPRFTHRWVWLLNILAASGIVGGFAYLRAAAYLPPDRHCEDLHFGAIDCLMFAFTAMIYTAITCTLLSLLLKWKSIANKKIPF